MKEKHYDDLGLMDKNKWEELNEIFDLDSLFEEKKHSKNKENSDRSD